MVVGIIGATGLVGQTLVSILSDSLLPIELRFLTASQRSVGKKIPFRNTIFTIEDTTEDSLSNPCDVVFITSSSDVSHHWQSFLLKKHRWVIDLSSAFRLDHSVPLLVPDVNANAITRESGWISNPNCSTIQLVKTLFPIHRLWGVRKVIVSTYQSVSGMGQNGIDRLSQEEKGLPAQNAVPLHHTVCPWIGNGSHERMSEEESKMIQETRKILENPILPVYPTAVRVPVPISHCESVYLETDREFRLDSVRELWRHTPGIVLSESPGLPSQAAGTNDVLISRIRSLSPNTLQCWVVADNIRVGSAWNAYQILECLAEKGLTG